MTDNAARSGGKEMSEAEGERYTDSLIVAEQEVEALKKDLRKWWKIAAEQTDRADRLQWECERLEWVVREAAAILGNVRHKTDPRAMRVEVSDNTRFAAESWLAAHAPLDAPVEGK